MMLVCGAFQVEGFLVVIDDFQHCHVVGALFSMVKLLLEGPVPVEMHKGKLVT
jgi:hypothetical protein